MKKRIFSVLTALALVLAAGCSAPEEEPAPQGTGAAESGALTLNIHLGGEPSSIDPAFVTADDGGSYALHLFEGLVAMGPGLEPAPAAAESWTVEEDEDGLPVYTFTLREGAVWSDGTPVTAQDFVYAWRRVLDPDSPSPSAYQLYPIHNAQAYHEGVATQGEDGATTIQHSVEPDELGIEAVDDATLRVTLEGPCPDFLSLLTLPAYCPVRQDVVEANPDTWTQAPETCIGNGRYMLKEWNHDRNLSLVWNDQHWDPQEPASTFLNFILSDDTQAVFADFSAGLIQYASAVPSLERAAQEEAGTLTQLPRAGVYYYYFNCGSEPFDDPLVRRAISLAIDREALAQAMGEDLAPAFGLVPDGIPDTLAGEDFSQVEPPISQDAAANLAEAQELLAEAGYPGGAGFPQLTFLANQSEAHEEAARQVQQMLAEGLGIDMQILALSTQEYQEALAGGDWDMTRGGLMGYRLDPAPYLDGWSADASANYGGFSSENYEALLEASWSAPEEPEEEAGDGEASSQAAEEPQEDASGEGEAQEGDQQPLVIPETRMEILHDMERLLVAEEAAAVPLWQYRQAALEAPGLSGAVSSPLGYRYFQYAAYEAPAAGEDSSQTAQ